MPALAIEAVVFDWAGTIVDFGSLAPMQAFVQLFQQHGVNLTTAQARGPMGLAKRAHIAALAALPTVAGQWKANYGREFSEADADALLVEFEPMSAASALAHSAFIPGFLGAYQALLAAGLRVATTTGYTRAIMEPLIALARSRGFQPDAVVCCDDITRGRPDPMGMQRCMQAMNKVGRAGHVVKVDDTVPGIQEGLNAGCWTVGVSASGNALGWTLQQWQQATPQQRLLARETADAPLLAAGAHEVIESVADLPLTLAHISARMARGERP